MAADPQALAQSHSTEVWAAFCGALTIIIGLVTVLYNRLNQDIKDLWTQVEALRKEGKECEVRQGEMKTDIGNLKKEDESIYESLDRIDTGQRESDRKLERILAEHDNCIPRKLSLRGDNN